MVWAFSSHCALWAHLTPSHTGLSLTRGHQWILSAARLLIFKSLLFLNNLFSDLLICFSIPHVQSTASTEICSAFKKKWPYFIKSVRHPTEGCADATPSPSSAIPPCLPLITQPVFIQASDAEGKLENLALPVSCYLARNCGNIHSQLMKITFNGCCHGDRIRTCHFSAPTPGALQKLFLFFSSKGRDL